MRAETANRQTAPDAVCPDRGGGGGGALCRGGEPAQTAAGVSDGGDVCKIPALEAIRRCAARVSGCHGVAWRLHRDGVLSCRDSVSSGAKFHVPRGRADGGVSPGGVSLRRWGGERGQTRFRGERAAGIFPESIRHDRRKNFSPDGIPG